MAQWQRAGFLTAVLITLWIVVLHILNLFHAGPFWRDEIDSVDFAGMATVGEIWHNLRYDASPPLFIAVARVWTLAGLTSDFSYRVLGFLIGMGMLLLLWWCSRKMGGKMPLFVLALYAANPIAIRVGDALRPYGLGIALTLLTLTLIWNFVQSPGRRALFWAALAAILSVQCLYQNALFVAAFCCGAWVVTLGRREWKTAWQTGIIGLAAALSLLPYWVVIREGQMSIGFRRQGTHLDGIWHLFRLALQASGGWATPAWLALVAAGLAVAAFYGTRHGRWDMIYCGTVLVAGTIFYLLFLRVLGLPPHAWYFLILMAPAALMADSILGGLDMRWAQMARAVLCVVLVAFCVPACYAGVRVRQSNMDLVAAKLKAAAQPEDLILVYPWFYGISLQRYFDASRWTTLPPMEELRIHRFDLVNKAMMTVNPIGPVLDKVQATLRSGHRLWLVGPFESPPGDNPPTVYAPYNGDNGKTDYMYESNWMSQITYCIAKHATGADLVSIPVPGGLAVNPFENAPVQVIHGWQE
jgi:hypothetical protein